MDSSRVRLSDFLRAVWSHWVTLMSGCAAIVLLGVGERLSGYNVPWYAYTGVLMLFIFVACFRAWRDARLELIRAEEEAEFPEITGEIEEAFVYSRATQRRLTITYIALRISLVNTRAAVTTIRKYRLAVLMEGKEYEAKSIPFRDIRLEKPEFDRYGLPTYGEHATEEFRDLEEEKLTPLTRGVITRGWLRFALVERLVLPQTECRLVLAITDAFGKEHKLEAKPSYQPSGNLLHIIREERR